MNTLIKVCGLRDPENIGAIASLEPDYLGFIFYPLSKRKAEVERLTHSLSQLPISIKRVGVFVNETETMILEIALKLDLDCIQLHGDESPIAGKLLKNNGLEVWKVFGLDFEKPDWSEMEKWMDVCDAFLFDTASKQYGGTGKTFNHSVLENYPFQKPFWLSGGIGPEFRSLPQFFNRLPFLGLDINSKFESEPGVKIVEEVKTFIQYWKS